MYQVGDFVVKANNGVCRIEDIVFLDMSGVDNKKQYYYLVPVEDKGAKLYVPVELGERDLRDVMNEEEAWKLIHQIPVIEAIVVESEKLREQTYKDAIKSCNPVNLVATIKHLHTRREERLARGKRTTAVDDRYFRMAENALYSELAFAIGRRKDEMEQIIQEELTQQTAS